MKNDQCHLVGTVKVKNIAFEKEVIIRWTDNEWKSYYDRPCKYLCNRHSDAYDTFQFDFEIPRDDAAHQRIEFSVCFKPAGGQECWDSNDGKNYEVISELLRQQRTQTQPPVNSNGNGTDENGNSTNGLYGKPMDAFTLNVNNWTEFASWSDLSTQGPYW